jgi:hypothetical protein
MRYNDCRKLYLYKMTKKLFYIFLIFIVWNGCNETDIEPVPTIYDYSYFPMDSLSWREFEVTFIEIDKPSNRYDTTQYFLLEKWAGIVLNATGDSMVQLERYKRLDPNQTWNILSIWQAGIASQQAIQVEENIRYVKLNFPLFLNKSWDGNKYNRLDTSKIYDFKIILMDGVYTNKNISLDSVLTVVQKNKSTEIDKLYFDEKYAPGVGLIEKQQTNIYSGRDDYDPTVPIENRITKGTLYTQKLTGYGN